MASVTSRRVRLKSDQLKELAARRCETIKESFSNAGVDYDNGYRWLSGRNSPGAASCRKLLAYFKVDFDDLFQITDRPTEDAE